MNIPRVTIIRSLAMAIAPLLTIGAADALAQTGGPIKLVSPYAPGSGPEIATRILAEEMAPRLGTQVVVENRVGASGKIAVESLVRSEPDGRTLLFAGGPQLLIIPAIDANPTYDIFRDTRMVSLTTKYELVLLTGAGSGIKTARDLFARIRQKPNNVTYYSTGAGTQGGLAGKILADVLGGEATAVTYKGTTLALPDAVAGRISFGVDAIPGRLEMTKTGQLIFLATLSRERLPMLPNVPTLLEEGLADFYKINWSPWNAVIAPARTPDDLVSRLNRVIVESMGSPNAKAKLSALFLDNAAGPSPQEATRFWRADYEAMRPALIAAGAKFE